jgi:hypothetical protein
MFQNKANGDFNGFFRGVVTSNSDDTYTGRIKVWVPGIYPDEFETSTSVLPWAEPAMGIFGGSGVGTVRETGVTSSPNVGADVWVFFEQGDHMHPIYCFAVQAGEGWISEHVDQHTIQSDNVRITLDDAPAHPNASRSYTSNNTKNVSTKSVVNDMVPTLDIDVLGMCNININGNANFKVNGNLYHEVTGDVYETVGGNKYSKVYGSTHEEYVGAVLRTHKYNTQDTFEAGRLIIITGDKIETITQDCTVTISGNETRNIADGQAINTTWRNLTVVGDHVITCTGSSIDSTNANRSIVTNGLRSDETLMDHQILSLLLRLN